MVSSLIFKEEKKLASGGGSTLVYLPKELRPFVKAGDKVSLRAEMIDGLLRIVIMKKIFNFTLQDVKGLANEFGLKKRYEGKLDGTIIFDAANEYLSLKYLESEFDKPPHLGRLILSVNFSNLAREEYYRLAEFKEDLTKQGYDVLLQPEGDIDTISLVENAPNFEPKSKQEVIDRLKRAGKKVSFSLALKVDNMRYNLEQIRSLVIKLKEIHSQIKTI